MMCTRHREPRNGNRAEPSAHCFLAESSDKRPSAQYLRPNLQPIYHYQNKSRYCILFLSKHYVAKLWTKHELQSAQARALREQDAYILTIRFDDTQIPGILPTIAYLDWSQETPETIADLLVEKLKVVSRDYAAFAKR